MGYLEAEQQYEEPPHRVLRKSHETSRVEVLGILIRGTPLIGWREGDFIKT